MRRGQQVARSRRIAAIAAGQQAASSAKMPTLPYAGTVNDRVPPRRMAEDVSNRWIGRRLLVSANVGSADVEKLLKMSPLYFQPFTVRQPSWIMRRQVSDPRELLVQLALGAQQRTRVSDL